MKKCPYCAELIQEDARKCRFCGEWLSDEAPSPVHTKVTAEVIDVGPAVTYTTPPAHTTADAEFIKKYRGVRGMLLFLCFALTFLGPVTSCGRMFDDREQVKEHFNMVPQLEQYSNTEMAILSFLILFSFCAGIMLWSGSRSGLTMAKGYFACAALYSVVGQYVLAYLVLPSAIIEAAVPTMVANSIVGSISFLVWYSYLTFSKRVKATYLMDHSAVAATATPTTANVTPKVTLPVRGSERRVFDEVGNIIVDDDDKEDGRREIIITAPYRPVRGYHPTKRIRSEKRRRNNKAVAFTGASLVVATTLFSLALALMTERTSPSSPPISQSWPAVFTANKSLPTLSGALPLATFSTEEFQQIALAYGYIEGQRITLRRIEEELPSLRAKAMLALADIKLRYGQCVDGIEDFYKEHGIDKAMVQHMQDAKLMLSEQTLTEEDAVWFLEEVAKRVGGEMPSNVRETLMLFHKGYRQNPFDEIHDKQVWDYRSPRNERSSQLEIGIKVPSSWKTTEGRRPHVVQKFRSRFGRGALLLTITADSDTAFFPGALTMVDTSEIAGTYLSSMEEIGNHHVELLASGNARLAGQDAVWFEASATFESAGLQVEGKLLCFLVPYGNHVISLIFMVSPEEQNETLDQAYSRYASTIQYVVTTFEIFNKYD